MKNKTHTMKKHTPMTLILRITLIFVLSILSLGIAAQGGNEGERFLHYERNKSAEQAFHKLLMADPNNSDNWFGLAESYIKQEKALRALDTLRNATASVQSDPIYKVAIGAALLSTGNKSEAQTRFTEALDATRRKDVKVLAAVAIAQLNSKDGDLPLAAELLDEAIKR